MNKCSARAHGRRRAEHAPAPAAPSGGRPPWSCPLGGPPSSSPVLLPPPALSSSRHFCRAALSLFGHFPARHPGPLVLDTCPGQGEEKPGRGGVHRGGQQQPPPAPRLLPEQKQLLLKGKESEEGARSHQPRAGTGRVAGLSPPTSPRISYGSVRPSRAEEAGSEPARRAPRAPTLPVLGTRRAKP